MDISTQLNNVLCIKDVFIMERTDELFMSTPLNTAFILDNKIWTGFAFDKKISRLLGVTEAEADNYLQHCMTVFSKSANINQYKLMDADTLLNECIKEIRRDFDIDNQGRHRHDVHSNHKKYRKYHVLTSGHPHRSKVYTLNEESDDSDDELPSPTNHFGDGFKMAQVPLDTPKL